MGGKLKQYKLSTKSMADRKDSTWTREEGGGGKVRHSWKKNNDDGRHPKTEPDRCSPRPMVASPNAHAPMTPHATLSVCFSCVRPPYFTTLAPMPYIPPSHMPMPPIPLMFFLCHLTPLCYRGYGHTSMARRALYSHAPLPQSQWENNEESHPWTGPDKCSLRPMAAFPQCPCPYVPMYPWPYVSHASMPYTPYTLGPHIPHPPSVPIPLYPPCRCLLHPSCFFF